jgi:predicted transcriptional regulator of viral defense system
MREVAATNDTGGRATLPPHARVARLAAARHGVLTLDELAEAGVDPRTAQRWAARGLLHRVHRGVYAVGHPGLSPDGRRRAAVMTGGRGAALAFESAVCAWGFGGRRVEPRAVQILVPRGRRVVDTRIVAHAARSLGEGEVVSLRGIATTTVARTLVDVASQAPGRETLSRLLHEALVQRLVSEAAVAMALDRSRGRRGVALLRELLFLTGDGATRSRLEERFTEVVAAAGLPAPRRNARVRGYEVDALWADPRVIVELDGARYHGTRRAFEADRRRDAALVALGYVVVRLTWRRVTEEAAMVASELRTVLKVRGGSL